MGWRTNFVVSWMAILFVFAWVMALGNKFQLHFWDRKYAMEKIKMKPREPLLYNTTFLNTLVKTYYSHRYFVFFPHVFLSIIWWNVYFLQLIPTVRRWSLKFHRRLGRLLMVVAILQGITGSGVAYTSESSTIKIVSYFLTTAVFYCVWKAWMFAYRRDIPRHKYWSMRLVGYLQGIALQRFYMFAFIFSHQMGWHGLYPSLESADLETVNRVVRQIFHDTFVASNITATFATEWYLSAYLGMSHFKEIVAAPDSKKVSFEKRTN